MASERRAGFRRRISVRGFRHEVSNPGEHREACIFRRALGSHVGERPPREATVSPRDFKSEKREAFLFRLYAAALRFVERQAAALEICFQPLIQRRPATGAAEYPSVTDPSVTVNLTSATGAW